MVKNVASSDKPPLWEGLRLGRGGALLELASSALVSLSILVLRGSHGQCMVWRHGARPFCGAAFHAGGGLLFCASVSFVRDQCDRHGVLCGIRPLRSGGELGEFLEKV